jgi:hypothetical protein
MSEENKSFKPIPYDKLNELKRARATEEGVLLGYTLRSSDYAFANAYIGAATIKENLPPLDWETATHIATLECAALQQQYPQLFTLERFPSCYRLFRALEISGDIGIPNRKSLFIGSGSTTDEYVARYIRRPSQEQVTKLARTYKDDTSLFMRDIAESAISGNIARLYQTASGQQAEVQKPIAYHTGEADIVEPDTELIQRFEYDMPQFNIPDERIKTHPMGLEEFIQQHTGEQFGTIIWHRLLPELINPVFDPNFSKSVLKRSEQDIRQSCVAMRDTLLKLTQPGGSIIFTVGTGNTAIEGTGVYQARKAAINYLAQAFTEEKLKTSIHDFITTPSTITQDRLAYGGPYGSEIAVSVQL